ncbi:MAG: hypothetical protein V5B40_05585 [Candidatus Accumulibacter meliphilus]|uniref:hypothetical protein n=1 Tax=Candidatus Accumulibacter meliphilus TaxID=2211374 RepID=UPI002FC39DA0
MREIAAAQNWLEATSPLPDDATIARYYQAAATAHGFRQLEHGGSSERLSTVPSQNEAISACRTKGCTNVQSFGILAPAAANSINRSR